MKAGGYTYLPISEGVRDRRKSLKYVAFGLLVVLLILSICSYYYFCETPGNLDISKEQSNLCPTKEKALSLKFAVSGFLVFLVFLSVGNVGFSIWEIRQSLNTLEVQKKSRNVKRKTLSIALMSFEFVVFGLVFTALFFLSFAVVFRLMRQNLEMPDEREKLIQEKSLPLMNFELVGSGVLTVLVFLPVGIIGFFVRKVQGSSGNLEVNSSGVKGKTPPIALVIFKVLIFGFTCIVFFFLLFALVFRKIRENLEMSDGQEKLTEDKTPPLMSFEFVVSGYLTVLAFLPVWIIGFLIWNVRENSDIFEAQERSRNAKRGTSLMTRLAVFKFVGFGITCTAFMFLLICLLFRKMPENL